MKMEIGELWRIGTLRSGTKIDLSMHNTQSPIFPLNKTPTNYQAINVSLIYSFRNYLWCYDGWDMHVCKMISCIVDDVVDDILVILLVISIVQVLQGTQIHIHLHPNDIQWKCISDFSSTPLEKQQQLQHPNLMCVNVEQRFNLVSSHFRIVQVGHLGDGVYSKWKWVW